MAGNIAHAAATLNIDLTGPGVSALPIPSPNGYGWNNSQVEVRFSGNDALSGLAYCESPKTVSIQGSSIPVSGYCADNAGNSSTTTITVSIDTVAPQVSYAFEPAANDRDWHNTAVRVAFSGTDTISGLEHCSSATLSSEGADRVAVGNCADLAGNIAYATATVNIDMTPAAIVISSPLAGRTFIATRGEIGIDFTVTDNLDPSPKASARLLQIEDKGSPRGGRPAVIAVTYGQLIEPLDIDDGIWRLAVSATDFADNTSTLSGGTFEVVHDVLAPRTRQTIPGGASLTDGATTYITSETVLKFSSVDDLVLAEDGIGLGVKKQTIKLKTSGSIVKELAFENPEPKQGTIFNSTFTLAATSGLVDGFYNLAYYAEDILGNIEGEKTLLMGLDNTAPVTTAELTGTSGENGWHISAVSVKLTASDALSDVAGIYYQSEFNGQKSELRSYTGPFTVGAEGLYKVYFYAKDRLGNTEAEKTMAFKIDRTDPLISAERTPPANTYGWNNTVVTVNYLCADGLSGVKSCPPAAVLAGEGLNQSTSGEAKDHAGNSSSVTISGINIDKTVPVSAYMVEGIVYKAGDGKTYLSPASMLSLTAADPVSGGAASGIDIMEYYIDSAPFLVYASSFSLSEGSRSVYYRSRDRAGNIETAGSAEFQIDGTAPATSLNISSPLYTAEEARYVTPQSVLWFTASDPLSNDTASGVLLTKYRLDGGAWRVYTGSFTITAEGRHTLEYYSLDRVQNAETLKSVEIAVDNTPPVSRLASGRPKYELDGYTLVSPATLLTLEAADPLSGGIASGVSGIYYSLGASPAVPYLTPFSLAGRGLNTVRWWSVDNVQNTESAHTAVYELDDEAPVLKLACPGESFGGICNIYNSTFTVYGTVSDKYMKSWRLEYAPGADAQGGYLPVSSGSVSITTGAIGLLNPAGLAGAYTLRLSAADLVENAAVRQVNIRIGWPSVQLSLGGHRLLNKPEAVAADGAGRLYIADTNNDRLALYTSTGGFTRYYGSDKEADDGRGKRTAAPRFNKPGAVALAGNNIYVSDTNNNRVVKLSTAGEVLLAIGGRAGGEDDDDKKSSGPADPLRLDKPRGLAVDAAGNIYVADSGNNRLLKLDPAGKELVRIILPVITKDDRGDDDDDDESAAAGPRGLALDGAGNIYITDPAGGRVLIYDALGGLLTQVKAFKKPHGIAVSPEAECLLIADAKTGKVYKLDRNKAVNLSFGAKAGGNDETGKDDDDDKTNDPLSPEFNKPGLLAFGADGSLYLADRNNNRVVKLGLPVAAPLVIDGRKGGKNRTSAALAVQGNLIAPLAGPDPSFRLGEVYVFPNPAKGGEAPVFHIETGIADTVKITIYTISGRAAHEQTLTGMPAELDDGNGLSYAYEYVWRGHIPSGVYLYYIETQKAGQKLKKTGKFSVVR